MKVQVRMGERIHPLVIDVSSSRRQPDNQPLRAHDPG